MKIQLLGTAAAEGWPALFCACDACKRARALGGKNIRTRSGALVDDRYKFDFGPDTYHHVLAYGLDLSRMDHLIFTHSHEDHLAPDEMLNRYPPFGHVSPEGPATLHVWGNEKVRRKIEAVIGGQAADPQRIELHPLEPFTPTAVGDAVVTPLLADHDSSERCFIHLFELEGKRFLYGHDTGIFPDATWTFLRGENAGAAAPGVAPAGGPVVAPAGGSVDSPVKGPVRLDAVILDCTFGPGSWSQGHMGIPACLEVQRRLLEMGCADGQTVFVATHFSHNGGLMHHELEAALAGMGFLVAYDGMVVQI